MPPGPIYVDKTLFLGRVEEQKQFRAALNEVLAAPPGQELPYILLLFGDGGMGKTSLAKRFRDIAQTEHPFEGIFQVLWVGWEDERRRYPALQGGREYVSPEIVFDVIHANAVKQNWGKHFGAYQDAVKKRTEAEKKVAEALSTSGGHDELGALRGVGTSVFAKVLRVSLPIGIGDAGEQIAKTLLDAGIKVGTEQATQLRVVLEYRLRGRLDPKQFDLFLHPNEQLGRALAEGLRKIAASKPLIIFLDTYEIVDRADFWLRATMRAAGTQIVWIVSGRDNLLRSRQFGTEFYKGYADDFSSRLIAFDMHQLSEQDIRALFADRAPDRTLSESEIQVISRATRGVPLALDEAAEMWSKGIKVADIVGDNNDASPRGEIVQKMTARYLLHTVADADRQTIYALALSRGDIEILRTMLRPVGAAPFDLDTLLHRLERDYASVHYEHARLHDEPTFFLCAYLKDEIHRTEDRVKILNQRAVEALRLRLNKLQIDLPRLEDRCTDADWAKTALDLTEYLFWLDEGEAWHWLIPRLVEGLAYSKELRRGLLQIANSWIDWLTKGGQKRVKVLRATDDSFRSLDKRADMLDELSRLENLEWLSGEGDRERSAILDWQRGELLYKREKYTEALGHYERAEHALPENGEALKAHLGEALYQLAGGLMWPQGTVHAVYSVEAERSLQKVVDWFPEKKRVWYRLGVAFLSCGKLREAIPIFQRAIKLDPNDAYSHNGLGLVYEALGKRDDAFVAFQRAIEFDPNFAAPYNSLGHMYDSLAKYDEALVAYHRAIDLDPNDAYPHNGIGLVYEALGKREEALTAYQRSIELDPKFGIPHNNIADIYIKQRKFDDALRELRERIRLGPENSFTPLVSIGVITRHQGHATSNDYFTRALVQWDTARNAQWHTQAGLLVSKAEALICLGKKYESMQVLRQAIVQMMPGDTIEFDPFTLLQTAPFPPVGLEDMIALLKEAQGKRKSE